MYHFDVGSTIEVCDLWAQWCKAEVVGMRDVVEEVGPSRRARRQATVRERWVALPLERVGGRSWFYSWFYMKMTYHAKLGTRPRAHDWGVGSPGKAGATRHVHGVHTRVASIAIEQDCRYLIDS